MRRQGNYEASSSSIALLQERFRNLQKVKEMREGREQLQMMMASGTTTSSALPAAASSSSEQPGWFLHPELVRPPRPVHGPAASAGFRTNGAAEVSLPPSVNVARSVQNSGCRSDVEVDTSLHL